MTAPQHSEPAGRHAQTDPLYPLIEDTRQLVTILDLVRWATSRMDEQKVFLGHGTQQYWDEAAWLVLDSLHLPLDLDAMHWSAKLTPGEITLVTGLIRRRCLEHIPTAYLLNRAWFMGQPYYVDERVLIPRSPFAELIAQHFEPWYGTDTPPASILDIGTGSGCLAIALAQYFPEAMISACDISMDALSIAARNVRDYQLEDRVELYQSDLLDNLKDETDAPLRFDLIISNPPYVDPAEAEDMPEEYHHEPAMALYAPNQGLALVERMLDTAGEHLSPDGYLFVEVGNGRRLIDQTWPQHRLSWIEMHNQEAALFTIACSDLANWRG
ncbi:50S ribosomal protein L3 N(5)-glutamine methyltransferase [Halothiobacillus neapolitanus]|uniref:Protein-(Glutamine-N5) methyltransferase, ribosomal protein L3-specific n=1 Tax=Halothiobacillus neapolitanus (strain ATCC 23641 / DSM 15147 / CIP 104769 / NCIMB 8539 / c2) TaxID=555778 RepID=D0KYC7_HALNC|nr:50S ribosomal protein L3 N(5)-glutamine methyltransferase [Halothiobacillus neapolitanus]ACX95450.1 protein-(glutamine-N5) methyltransferase, ribosomal protein L3-specific [Halothiobacillus neapolitanus c2]TDN65748.1 [LSU ribosomal protein L3P]-glutamine N5-methyltransferase [Halothiobacillus neapolitanus]